MMWVELVRKKMVVSEVNGNMSLDRRLALKNPYSRPQLVELRLYNASMSDTNGPL